MKSMISDRPTVASDPSPVAGSEAVPQQLVERLVLGELSKVQAGRVKARLAAEVGGMERVAALQADNHAILNDYTPAAIAHCIGERARVAGLQRQDMMRRQQQRKVTWLSALSGLAACAIALVVVAPWSGDISDSEQPEWAGVVGSGLVSAGDGTRDKGLKPGLVVVLKAGESAEPLVDGALVSNHDRLQLKYRAAGRPFGALVSIDGVGVVTLHFPEHQDSEAAVEPSGEHALPFAYELDDAPGFERFFFVGAYERLDVDAVMIAARELAADPMRARLDSLQLPWGAEATSVLLVKRPVEAP